jgi:hypothetical protein
MVDAVSQPWKSLLESFKKKKSLLVAVGCCLSSPLDGQSMLKLFV